MAGEGWDKGEEVQMAALREEGGVMQNLCGGFRISTTYKTVHVSLKLLATYMPAEKEAQKTDELIKAGNLPKRDPPS
ncbi:hypothetical protein PHYPSEUDO_002531 [Phytophthora pseudosyringae]|uniref:Uncharacterized protein n=1 Tax=Phytophthora pseudosyringae TaxID=221518 RepID=A0A8T1VX55_9STRA|nr:hypothetical protein PHYPSEUDO_002531 [Phytophthora pseudosyringae]